MKIQWNSQCGFFFTFFFFITLFHCFPFRFALHLLCYLCLCVCVCVALISINLLTLLHYVLGTVGFASAVVTLEFFIQWIAFDLPSGTHFKSIRHVKISVYKKNCFTNFVCTDLQTSVYESNLRYFFFYYFFQQCSSFSFTVYTVFVSPPVESTVKNLVSRQTSKKNWTKIKRGWVTLSPTVYHRHVDCMVSLILSLSLSSSPIISMVYHLTKNSIHYHSLSFLAMMVSIFHQ